MMLLVVLLLLLVVKAALLLGLLLLLSLGLSLVIRGRPRRSRQGLYLPGRVVVDHFLVLGGLVAIVFFVLIFFHI